MSDFLIEQETINDIMICPSQVPVDRFDDSQGTCLVLGPTHYRPLACDMADAWRKNPTAAAEIDGHFIVLYKNNSDKTISIVRDKGGFGHAYYAHTPRGWVCSSSLSWLARHRRQAGGENRLSRTAIALYLAFGYITGPWTPVDHVHQVSAGGVLNLGAVGTPVVRRPTSNVPGKTDHLCASEADIAVQAELIIDILRKEAIARRRFLNGMTGMLISGGMDSSTNAAIHVGELGECVLGFTAQFAEQGYDETESASAVARHYGFDHHPVPVRSSGLRELENIVTLFDSPNSDQAIYAQWIVAKAAARLGCTAMITGEGGDEVLGYPRSHHDDLHPGRLPAHNGALAREYFQRTHLAHGGLLRTLYERLGVNENAPHEELATVYQQHCDRTPFERVLFGQWATWLVDGVYQKDYRVFSGVGIEPVLPFTSNRLMRHIASLSPGMKLVGLDDKRFLRTALADKLPANVLRKPKHKFWVPVGLWLREDPCAYSYAQDRLLSSGLSIGLFGQDIVERLLTEHWRRHADHGRILWALLILELWYQEHASSWAEMPG
jgi:asparagine synthase (glutamine-hydrolysing)